MILPITYEFIQDKTNIVLGRMAIKYDLAGAGAWTTTDDLDDILDGGLAGGLVFAFPYQEAEKKTHGHGTLSARPGKDTKVPYGSSDGAEIDIGCVVGNVSGYYNDNRLMTLTFDPEGVGDGSFGNSVTTMLNDAKDFSDLGIVQVGQGADHADKFFYIGKWIKKE